MKRYRVLYADPPWHYNIRGKATARRGPFRAISSSQWYRTMPLEELCDLPIAQVALDDAFLFLWVLSGYLEQAFTLIKAWGFRYRTVGFVWVKTRRDGIRPWNGLATYTLPGAELCLLCTRGQIWKHMVPYSCKQVVFAPILLPQGYGKVYKAEVVKASNHSKKPALIRSNIEGIVRGGPRLELFARQPVEGWDVYGDQISSSIILPQDKR